MTGRILSRLRNGLGGLAALVAFTAAPAIADERVFPTADKAELTDHYPDRVSHFPDGVTGLADVIYATVSGYRPLALDLYLPPKGKADRESPLILYIHGGGWVAGHMRHGGALADFPKALAALAKEGFVVASVEYRLSGEAPFPAALQDVRAAIRFLKANAGRYGVDPDRVALWGGSAGGQLAALAALSCGDAGFDPAPAPAGSECVQGAVVWYGVFDFAPLMAVPRDDAAARRFLDCAGRCDEDVVRRASPVSHIDAKDPPFLLIHGEADKVVDVAQSRAAEVRFKAAGVPVQSLYIPDVDHSFIGAYPAQTRAATVKAVNASFDFFHAIFDARPE